MQFLQNLNSSDWISIIGTLISIAGFIFTIYQLLRANSIIIEVNNSLKKAGQVISYQEIFYHSSTFDERIGDLKKIINFNKYNYASEKFDQVCTSITIVISSLEAANVVIDSNLTNDILKQLDIIRMKIANLKEGSKSSSESNSDLIFSLGTFCDQLNKLKSHIHQVRHLK